MTYEQKYKWLLSQMYIADVDLWEQDGLIRMNSIYFQFDGHEAPTSVAEVLEKHLGKSE